MMPEPAGGVAPAVGGPPAAIPTPTPTTAAPPAPLGEAVILDTGIAVEIVSIAATEVDAHGQGEAADPALVVELSARNDSTEPRAVDAAVVTLVADGGDRGIVTAAGDPSPLAGVIAPGESASGRYVFLLDPAVGREVTVSIDSTAGEPVAVFTGTYS